MSIYVRAVTTAVIAFVECGITDITGQAIVEFAPENEELTGIYIEGKAFSNKNMETTFEKMRLDNPQLTILSEWASEEFEAMVKRTFHWRIKCL